MKTNRDTISVRQLMFIFTIIISSPATRFLPSYTSQQAKQAGWVSPVVALLPLMLLILIMNTIFKKYEEESMVEIIEDIMGRFAGKAVTALYLLWATWLIPLYMRYSSERLVSSVYSGYNNSIFVIINLVFIVYIIRSKLTVIGRMAEIILPVIGAFLFILAALLLPQIRLDNVAPIYFNDIIPILKASRATMVVFAYMFLLLFLSDRVNGKGSFKKLAFTAAFVNVSSVLVVLFITIGVLSSSIASRSPVPVLLAVKQVSIADTIENIEAIVVAVWIFADFMLLSAMIITALNIMRSLFKLSDTAPLLKIYVALIYLLTFGIAANKLELEDFSRTLITPVNIFFGFIVPLLLFGVGKIRGKL